MLDSEKWCNTYQNGSIEFSPVVGLWIRRMQLHRWICRFLNGKVAHAGNLFWACQCMNIPDLNTLTPKEVTLNKGECVRCLTLLKESTPKLQNKHLCSCLDEVHLHGDNEAVQAIIGILQSELTQKRWRALRRTINPNCGGAVMCLKVPHEDGYRICYERRS
jgi:hypothetical protein